MAVQVYFHFVKPKLTEHTTLINKWHNLTEMED